MEKLINWAKESEEKRLRAEVINMKPLERKEYLTRVADIYLSERSYDKEEEKWMIKNFMK
jgi:hypothetical protein